MKNSAIALALVLSSFVVLPSLASAECMINGHISVEETDNPLGAFQYTLSVEWDMDSVYGLSHLNLVVDAENGTCGCEEFDHNINFPAISGTTDGEGGCLIDYTSELACDGDPSIDFGGILFKFEPVESSCEPGPSGSGSFVFYSDLPGVPVNEQVIGLVDKAAHDVCTGTLSGYFPAFACDPVATDGVSWDGLKGMYR